MLPMNWAQIQYMDGADNPTSPALKPINLKKN